MRMTTEEFNLVQTITEQVREEHDRFVFETIQPWCQETTKMVISKKILCRALQCFKEEHLEEYAILMKEAEKYE